MKQSTDVWLTPQRVLRSLGTFDLDPCACSTPRPWPTARRHYALPRDGLKMPWIGRVWLNPPYSDPEPWLKRIVSHKIGMALLTPRTETATWQQWVWPHASAVRFLRSRIHFCNQAGKTVG